jgi:hypothetical protein
MKYILTFITVVLLTACGSAPKAPEVIYKTQKVAVSVPAELVKNCYIPAPFNKDKYLKADSVGREEMFTDLVVNTYTYFGDCNKQWGILREYLKDQSEIIKRE